ncbi:MAG: hypothetical protein KGJ23_03720 [Euryarchaeota archaeon]|nr:hypothetical protein [Euryarchaeota archaeon]MDE1835709.1 hypothetical protein [Euryarchaeota archaeon]MDE1881559.1 hypothetical protein [Euryarchaeota archaeon]MDE2043899.1 hypothetical protein [Thermoplasmata archaeon]
MPEVRVKTVALDPDTYDLLRQARRGDETFNDVVRRLARPRGRLSDFAGIWSDMSAKDLRKVEEALARGKVKERARIRRLAGL